VSCSGSTACFRWVGGGGGEGGGLRESDGWNRRNNAVAPLRGRGEACDRDGHATLAADDGGKESLSFGEMIR
jgi:hypothetical protein